MSTDLEPSGPDNSATEELSLAEPVVSVPTTGLRTEELRARNRIQSPLLHLPCEILICTLLFAIDDTKRTPTWTIILLTSHYLCQPVLSTPQLWGGDILLAPQDDVQTVRNGRTGSDRDLRAFIHTE